MSRLLLEVIVQTVEDARAAAEGGADRLEVVRTIGEGGLTPPLSLVRAIAAETLLPLRVMVRENNGFETTPAELSALRRAADELAALGVDGIVLGFARSQDPGLEDMRSVLAGAPGLRVTFHRAFDVLRDPLDAIDRLAELPQVDRILTSGGDGTFEARCERLWEYWARAWGRVEIVAGGGVTEETLGRIVRMGCIREVHVGRAARDGVNPDAPVSADSVRRLRELVG